MTQIARIIIVFGLLISALHAQTKSVIKNVNGNTITESLTIGAGKTLTIASGASIVAANGSTLTGFGGSVTSVALSLPSIFSVSGSPVTESGTLTGTLATQSANRVFAGPLSGADAAPTFRALVAADIPDLTGTYQPVLPTGSFGNFLTRGFSSWQATSASSAHDLIHPNAPTPISQDHTWTWTGSSYVWRSISSNLNTIGSTQGQILFRNESAWTVLSPGTSGQVLTTGGAGANPTWTTVSSGLTIGTTSISGGTAGRLLTSGATVGELTLGSGVSTWLITPSSANLRSALTDETGSGAAVFATSPTLVTPVLGVASATDLSTSGRFFGASEPGYPQFTETGYPGNGMRVYSDRLDFWIGSSVLLTIQAGAFNVPTLTWTASNVTLSATSDGAGRLVQKSGTSPMSMSVANTYTSFTNKEEFEIGWVGNSNVCRLRPIKGSGGGSSRNAEFHTTETGVNWGSGSGSPEGVRTAPVGSLYTRTDGGSNTTLYVKESGTGNTGWVAK
jgi:hypothetical protein